jgi:hypothetical protein
MWLLTAVLLAVTLSTANGGQPTEDEETYDPRTEATKVVDGFLRAYRSGLNDSLLLERIGRVREWSITLREIGDRRLVKPLTEIIADTATYSDGVDAGAIHLLLQLRGKSAVPAIRQYLSMQSRPRSRLVSAAALTVLGEAESGIPVLEGYVVQPYPLSPGQVSTVIVDAFLDNWHAVRFDGPAQESIVASFFQRMVGSATGQRLTTVICYLLQKDERSRSIALVRAEDLLKIPVASRDEKVIQYGSIRVLLERFGCDRGKALLSKYQ